MSAPAGVIVVGVLLGFWPFVVGDCGGDPVEGSSGTSSAASSSSSGEVTSSSAGGEGGEGGAGGQGGGGGQGGTAGSSTTCEEPADCGDNGVCHVWACWEGSCLQDFHPAGFEIPSPNGDCKKAVCDGNGMETTAPDIEDVPGQSPIGDCQKSACDEQGNVTTAPDPADVPSDDGPDGDCLKNACDALGNIVAAPDPSDVPSDDGNDCTAEACDPGPVHVALETGASCSTNGGNLCQAGSCVPFIPVKCKVGGVVYQGCDGMTHAEYQAITVFDPNRTCHGNIATEAAYCAPGAQCELFKPNGSIAFGVCQ